jgi:hypothetical protein
MAGWRRAQPGDEFGGARFVGRHSPRVYAPIITSKHEKSLTSHGRPDYSQPRVHYRAPPALWRQGGPGMMERACWTLGSTWIS